MCDVSQNPMSSVRVLQLVAAIALLSFVGQRVTAELEHLGWVGVAHTDHHDSHRHVPSGENDMPSEHSGHHHHLVDIVLAHEVVIIPQGLAIPANSFLKELIYEGPFFAIDYPPQLS